MNALTSRPARAAALAEQEASIQRNVATIREQQARPSAIQAMASRLNLTPGKLQETLLNTVFRDANAHEFAALVIVANEYKLNPLTKEIFAFKAKGGGIIPYVSVDGWIRIINEHPQFDGIDFNDIVDANGDIEAIEAVIYRKDRSHPIRVTEYLDECRRDTDPWKKSPKRFLRHRALMQCGRVAFGFSGISSDDDYEIVGYAQQEGGESARNVTPPTRDQLGYDPDTGEVLDQDAPATEGRADREHGDQHDGVIDNDVDAREAIADEILASIKAASTIIDLNKIRESNQDDIDALPEEMAGVVNRAFRDAEAKLRGPAK